MLTVSITLFCLIGHCGDISKACFNPAVGLSVPFFHYFYASPDDPSHLDYVLAYTIGPILGGVIAAYLMTHVFFMYPSDIKDRHLQEINKGGEGY